MIVAKVGGSLYDDPRLGPSLRQWVSEQPEPVLLVPGGGEFADAVRKLDAVHGLGEEAAHWLAIRSLSVTAAVLGRLSGVDETSPPGPLSEPERGCSNGGRSTELPMADGEQRGTPGASSLLNTPSPARRGGRGVRSVLPQILDPFAFFTRHDLTPHTWAVTTDSLALAAAMHLKASKLVLLKSADRPPGPSWAEAAAAGFVDAHFPTLAAGASFPIEVVNFRRWAEFRFPAGGG